MHGLCRAQGVGDPISAVLATRVLLSQAEKQRIANEAVAAAQAAAAEEGRAKRRKAK